MVNNIVKDIVNNNHVEEEGEGTSCRHPSTLPSSQPAGFQVRYLKEYRYVVKNKRDDQLC